MKSDCFNLALGLVFGAAMWLFGVMLGWFGRMMLDPQRDVKELIAQAWRTWPEEMSRGLKAEPDFKAIGYCMVQTVLERLAREITGQGEVATAERGEG